MPPQDQSADTLDFPDRVTAFEAVYNFRDFGGYPAGPGARVAKGRLYRSAHIARATESDFQRIRGMGIAVAVDLRRTGEREAEPCNWPGEGITRVIATDIGERGALPPHLQFLRDTGMVTAEVVREHMLDTYRRLPFDDRYVELFSETFRTLAAGETPLLVHCAAGKDRTGVLCALIQDALGVARDDIFDDYALTNQAVHLEGILKQAAGRFSKRVGRTVDPEDLRPMVGVETPYLEAAFAVIESEAGSTAAYVTDVLKMDADALGAMRAHLVEKA